MFPRPCVVIAAAPASDSGKHTARDRNRLNERTVIIRRSQAGGRGLYLADDNATPKGCSRRSRQSLRFSSV
jgi:hypothetical protein